MNTDFLSKVVWRGEYELCPSTSTSYYSTKLGDCITLCRPERTKAIKNKIQEFAQANDFNLLPYRIGLVRGDAMPATRRMGRTRQQAVAQLKGIFSKQEVSPYKQHKPFAVHTSIWQVDNSIYYGSIGISQPNGMINNDNGDLLILKTIDWIRVEVYIFRGLAGSLNGMKYLDDAVNYVRCLSCK